MVIRISIPRWEPEFVLPDCSSSQPQPLVCDNQSSIQGGQQ